MWVCPKCQREFKNINQSHFCGESPTLIDAYIEEQPEEVQPRLHEIRNALRSALPDAEERISWRMPTYKAKKNIIHFAAFKNHIGIYPGDKAIEHFSEELTAYKTSKGAIQISNNEPLPLDLIIKIALWNFETENHH